MPDRKRMVLLVGVALSAIVLLLFFLPKEKVDQGTNQLAAFEPVEEPTELMESENSSSDELDAIDQEVIVDIKGEVKNPGIYHIDSEARVHDVIEKAGSYTDKAAPEWINLAERVVDEMVIIVPHEANEAPESIQVPAGQVNSSAGSSDNREGISVNINTGTLDELTTLPGVGPAKGEAIITYREENGSFQAIEELKEVTGIGEKTYETLQELITI